MHGSVEEGPTNTFLLKSFFDGPLNLTDNCREQSSEFDHISRKLVAIKQVMQKRMFILANLINAYPHFLLFLENKRG